jgi:DUF4097 and DUF4098 domain-containing protein YvlB
VDVTSPLRLRIANRSGSVRVRAGAQPTVSIDKGTITEDDDGWTTVTGGSDSLDVVCPHDTDITVSTTSGAVRMAGRLGAVRVMTESGRIRVEHASSADLRSASATVRIDACNDDCRVVTTSGRVRIGAAGMIDVNTSSGSILVDSAAGGDVHTVSGSVDVGTDGKRSIRIHTISSGVDVRVPPGRQPDSDLRSGSGRVVNDCPPGADGAIEVRTQSGAIRVRRR